MIAVVPVRGGRLGTGGDAAVAEAGGRVLVIGEGTSEAATSIRAAVVELRTCEAGTFAPASWARGLAGLLAGEPVVVLPGSPDGRDLAGRLAGELGRPCHAWCTEVTATHAVMTRHDGVTAVTVPLDGPVVATLVPRPASTVSSGTRAVAVSVTFEASCRDATVLGVDDADPAELDLADAERIVAGGMGLGGRSEFALLEQVAGALRASVGATRPIADRGILGHERQIGTTGVAVNPRLYVALGISGAVQHTSGLGEPERVVAVNTDVSCPMMARADLAVVADAAATLLALAQRLGVS